MTLKRKIALNLSIAFSILFGLVMIVIYILFNGFRKEEFKERFRKRLDFTITFIEKSKNFEEEAPLFFDENSDNVLLNEQILIFNAKRELIYSTIKDRKVSWDSRILDDLENKKIIFQLTACFIQGGKISTIASQLNIPIHLVRRFIGANITINNVEKINIWDKHYTPPTQKVQDEDVGFIKDFFSSLRKKLHL